MTYDEPASTRAMTAMPTTTRARRLIAVPWPYDVDDWSRRV